MASRLEGGPVDAELAMQRERLLIPAAKQALEKGDLSALEHLAETLLLAQDHLR